MIIQVADETRRRWLSDERRLLDALRVSLVRFEADRADLATLGQALADLDELFRLVIVGEFNAGKSALINALIGETVLQEGVTPTTAVVTVLRHGDEPSDRMREADIREIAHPAAFLRDISIVDTPGTNAIIQRHQEITEHFVPRSDLVLFVTSADRPFTETERRFLELIRDWGKKIVIVLNKRDLIERSEELAQIEQFIAENAERLLGIKPRVFSVSARQARRALAAADQAERDRGLLESGFAVFERYLIDTLDEAGRVRLKLLSPIGIGERLLDRYTVIAENRIALLNQDFETAEHIERQLAAYREDLERDFRPRLAEIENIIHETNQRGVKFFEETIRLGRVFDLFNAAKVREMFQADVLEGTAERIDRSVQDLIDWLMDHELRLWNAVMEYLARRRQTRYDDQIVGQVGGGFDYNRRELLQSVSRRARQVVETFDRQAEAHELASSVRTAVTQTAIAEAGAVGLGTAVAVIVGTAAADVTGVLAASVVAGLGLFIIPYRRKKATADFLKKTDDLRERLATALTDQFNREVNRSQERIRDAIAPYLRFVRTEHEKVTGLKADLDATRSALRALRAEIESGLP
ncbi:MAG TPA: dynamin family protein [Dehalococcoidia bacterium]|nr:dynamin family protein [Dehalococcoidia bacterium]